MSDASSSFLVTKWRHDDITSDIVKSYLLLASFLILSNRPYPLSIFLLKCTWILSLWQEAKEPGLNRVKPSSELI